MRSRVLALMLLSLWLVPGAEAGLFGGPKKKLPKPVKMVHIRSHDAERLAKPTKLSAKYGPSWGRGNEYLQKPQHLHMGHAQTD